MIKSNPDIISELDGRALYYSFMAGARKLIAHQVELNRINVFPVNDGDTGTNLAATIRAVIDSMRPHRSYKITADRIAETVLMHARGNSGIIFAQFFYGLSCETGDYKTVRIKEFAESAKLAVQYIYNAVANPVEGTMLTVIREWADYIYSSRQKHDDFNQMLLSSYEVLKRSLAETKMKLKILAKNNVVDAGANGFVLFIEGIIEYIHKRDLKELIRSRTDSVALPKMEEIITEEVNYRYCTEAVIKNTSIDQQSLMGILQEFGDSAVVAGSNKIRRIHVHTSNPADLFFRLKDYGTISFQKADDMLRQSESVFRRKYSIALLVDSTCDLDEEFIEKYQIHILPVTVSFGENHYLDKITIKPEHFYRMLETSPHYPKSSQVNESAFVNMFSNLASHYDSVISVILSEKLSGTFNSAVKAAEKVGKEFGKPVSVINSRAISGAAGLTVLRIAEAIEQGLPHEEIVKMAGEWAGKCRLYIRVDDIKYLIRGGRLSYTKGLVAKFLQIKPVLSLDREGKVIVLDKTFSRKASMEKIIERIRQNLRTEEIWNYTVMHANNQEDAGWYSKKIKELTTKEPISVLNISPVIGAHAGVGASAVAIMFR